MRSVNQNDGSWCQAITHKNEIRYTDSDGVWMTEKFNGDGLINSRLDSFGRIDKYVYRKEPILKDGKETGKFKTILDKHTTEFLDKK